MTEEEGRNESLSSPALVIISTNSKAKLATRKSKCSGKITINLLLPFQFITRHQTCVGITKGLKEIHENINTVDTIGLFCLFALKFLPFCSEYVLFLHGNDKLHV